MKPVAESLRAVDSEALGAWMREQRWFGAKAADLSHFGVLDVVPLREELALALVEARYNSGVHDVYQLMTAGDDFDVLHDPADAAILARLMESSAQIDGAEGRVLFHWTGDQPGLSDEPA